MYSLAVVALLYSLCNISNALPQALEARGAPVCTGTARKSQIKKIEAISNSAGYSACSSTLDLYSTATRTKTTATSTITKIVRTTVTNTAPTPTITTTQEQYETVDHTSYYSTYDTTLVEGLATATFIFYIYGTVYDTVTETIGMSTETAYSTVSGSTATESDTTTITTTTTVATVTNTYAALPNITPNKKRDIDVVATSSTLNLASYLTVPSARVTSLCSCVATGSTQTVTKTIRTYALTTITSTRTKQAYITPAPVTQTTVEDDTVTSTVPGGVETTTVTVTYQPSTTTVAAPETTVTSTYTTTTTVSTTATTNDYPQFTQASIPCNNGIYTGSYSSSQTLSNERGSHPIQGYDASGGIQQCGNICASAGNCNQFFAFSTYNYEYNGAGQFIGYGFTTYCYLNNINFQSEDCSTGEYDGGYTTDAQGYYMGTE